MKLQNKIMFKTEEEFLFENCVWYDEFADMLSKAKPLDAFSFYLSKPYTDYVSGDFVLKFFINENKIELPFYQNPENINSFWSFLEHILVLDKKLVFSIFYNSKETILYLEHISKTNIRIVFIEAKESVLRENMGRIIKTSYYLREPLADVIIKKKKFISSVYKTLISLVKSYENTSYFEQVTADISGWIKDSEIISGYLK